MAGSSVTGFDLYNGDVIVRSESLFEITNADLSNADDGDGDIHYGVTAGDLTIDSEHKLLIWTGSAFVPGGGITLTNADCQIKGVALLNIEGNALILNASGTLYVDGTLTITTGSAVLPADLDNSGRINLDGVGVINIEGNLTNTGIIDSTSASSTIYAAGDWDNSSGTFTAGTGIVIFDGGGVSNITGASSFYNLTCVTPGKNLIFEAGSTQTISNTLNLNGGAAGTEVVLNSSDGATRFNLDIASGQTVNYVDVSNSEALGDNITANESINRTNNDDQEAAPHWIFGPVTRYWVGVADDEDWDDNDNWSSASGGSGGANYPRDVDTAIFDGGNTTRCLFDIDAEVNVLDIQNGYDTGILNTAVYNLTIGDTLDVSDAELLLGAGSTLTVGGVLTIDGGSLNAENGAIDANSSVALSAGALTAPSTGAFTIAGDYTNSGGAFTSGAGTVTFDGTTTLTTGGAGDDNDFYNVIISGAVTPATDDIDIDNDLTIQSGGALNNANNLNISLEGDWTNAGAFTSGTGTVVFDGTATSNITGETSFYNLSCETPSKILKFKEAETFTITNTLTLDGGTAGTEVVLDSQDGSSQFTLKVDNPQTVSYVDVSNSNVDDTGESITATNSINRANNDTTTTAYWIFGPTTRYWVAPAAGDWDTNANWSSTSGGTPGADYPDAGDTSIFDGNGLLNCTLDANVSAAVIDIQGALDTNGDYTGTVDANGYDITLTGTLDISDGTLQLPSSSDLTVDGALTIDGGALDAENGTIDANSSVTLSSGTLTAPQSSFTIAGDYTSSGGTFTSGTGTVTFDGTSTIITGGTADTQDFNNVIVSGTATLSTNAIDIDGDLSITGALDASDQDIYLAGDYTSSGTFASGTGAVVFDGTGTSNITGTTTFYDLTCQIPSKTLAFKEGETFTITNTLTLDGGAAGT
ncbi:MAG: hypothetical protein KJ629_09465, partial [Candidatus Omnitrophica bacterium]|nr:hypothetical protein [Candidatus Omnitrophota bacterium]